MRWEVKKFEFNDSKFSELVLYVAKRSEDDPRFGAIKLNKILYYADFNAYRILGQPITGATYQKLSEGPAPRQMLGVRSRMLDAGAISIEHRPCFSGVQQRIVPRREPDKTLFTREELAIVDEAISALWHMTEREASDFSRRETGWRLARQGEDIPYETAWLSAEPVPQEAEEYGRELAEKLRG